MQVIEELAIGATSEEMTPHFAIIYDDLLRKELEINCGQIGDGSMINAMMTAVDPVVERRAIREYNLQCKVRPVAGDQRLPKVQQVCPPPHAQGAKGSGKRPAKGEPAGQQLGKKARVCFKCGLPGHVQANCGK